MIEPKFIKWTSSDEEGPFSYIGQVTCETEDFIEFVTGPNKGEHHVPKDEGTFIEVRKPRNWGDVYVKPEPKKEKRVVERKGTYFKKGSKKELAKKIYSEGLHKEEIIEQFMSELDMTKTGATTYYYNFNSGRW